jgi:signal transduction histidine kinase
VIDLNKVTEFEYNQNNLEVAFGYISFNNPTVFTRYRLNDRLPWNYTTNNNLQFNSLSPGTYTLELQYSVGNNSWTSALSFPPIIINPPLWRTWYFQTSIALVIILIIYLYFRSQIILHKKHQQKLIQSELDTIENERKRIAKDLHDSVATDFTAIKMMVTQKLKKYNEPNIHEVESQFQHTIHDIKGIIYGLAPPGLERYGLLTGLQNYVAKLNGTVPIKIEFNSYGTEIKDTTISIGVFRIIQELISNSLKYSEAEKISLHVNSFDDLLNILYEDNGKGFSWDENHNGLGLYNIESRVQSLKGQLRFESGDFGISYTFDIPKRQIT